MISYIANGKNDSVTLFMHYIKTGLSRHWGIVNYFLTNLAKKLSYCKDDLTGKCLTQFFFTGCVRLSDDEGSRLVDVLVQSRGQPENLGRVAS